ncbi:MAG: PTS mannitol transporter subunit IICBA [Deferribacteraceae bacterium]|jgi:PTS system mannitol-specific IIC component|nr:PTS mannitol transporter subunit IICBA [Deferribacteraceae bacterium]
MIKQSVQKFGRTLSGMVMPNIGAFIAWGFITALFIPTGWLPNEKFGALVGPMISYLLPLLIGYTGGSLVGKKGVRGGVVGAIATMGVIVGAGIPMFLGAMIAGPLGGFCIKKFDDYFEDKVPAGFEMLVNTFSSGIIGGALALICNALIGPVVEVCTTALGNGVGWLVANGLLPLTSIIVEPAKILFLNNAINHGVFTPLGTQQAQELGRSIYFMIESNPGPGLGLLMAYFLAGKGSAKSSAPGAAVIHFFGGIHEIYFPFVLMNPVLILAMIGGGFSGVLTLTLFGGGLIAPAAPGSIFAELAMTPKGAYLPNILGIIVGGGVSFVLSMILLKAFGKEEASLEDAQAQTKASKAQSKGLADPAGAMATSSKEVKKIVFACDAGMGSSAMGATKLKKKLAAAGLGGITVVHSPVGEVPADADVIVCHRELAERARQANGNARLIAITDFLGAPEYDELINSLINTILKKENIILNQPKATPEEVIRRCGKMLFESGYVNERYIEGMLARDKSFSVEIGNFIALPHGEEAYKKEIIKTGIVVLTYPDGIDWHGNTVYFVVGIAARGEEHLEIMANIVTHLGEPDDTVKLVKNGNIDEIYKMLTGN